MPLSCPRDGSTLVLPEDSDRSTFSRHGIHHCNECSGMLLNADAASSTISEKKLNKMHDSFETGGDEVDLDCPLCDSHMRVRNNAVVQLVSVFAIFCQDGIVCQSGGYASVTNSASNFGTYSLRATGFRTEPYSFDSVHLIFFENKI